MAEAPAGFALSGRRARVHFAGERIARRNMQDEPLARLRLARTEGVGPLTFKRLLARFGNAAQALEALPELAASAGRPGLCVFPEAAAARELATLRQHGGHLLCLGDRLYPPLLAQLTDPPPVLSVLGDPAVLSTRSIGLVGARNASSNGMRMAEALATELAAAGITVVSGLARGIDGSAHTGALHTGRTVAAIAGGLDKPYPPEHANLQARIAERGAVVTEAPWGTAPQSRHFPRRNRIIAGLSLGVVVVEAALRSGSLITARLAQDAGREVFAIPGSPMDPRCRGSNDLIRQGARITENAADILAELPDDTTRDRLTGLSEPVPPPAAVPEPTLPPVRAELLRLLSASPTDIDAVIRHSQFAPAAVMAALSQLELALRVEILPGNRVCLRPH